MMFSKNLFTSLENNDFDYKLHSLVKTRKYHDRFDVKGRTRNSTKLILSHRSYYNEKIYTKRESKTEIGTKRPHDNWTIFRIFSRWD